MSYDSHSPAVTTSSPHDNGVPSPATDYSIHIKNYVPNSEPPFSTNIIKNLDNLSAVYHDSIKHNLRRRKDDLAAFIKDDLDVERLDKVQWWLRLCGKKITTRPLHSLKGFYCRQIVVSDRADLHLCWDPSSSRMFIKPLPAYLLNKDVWTEHICKAEPLYRNSMGFLRTYIHLIPGESDFYSAREEGLLPRTYEGKDEGSELTWPRWCIFVDEFVTSLDKMNAGKSRDTLNRVPDILRRTRWEYSELRLNRLSQIYRFRMGKVFRGYTFSYQSYGSFLSRNSSWLIAAFAYVAIVHGAMQVGLGTPQLGENDMFLNVSYGFSVFSIIAPISILFLIILWIVLIFLDNLIHMLLSTLKWDKNHSKTGDIEMHPVSPPAHISNAPPQ